MIFLFPRWDMLIPWRVPLLVRIWFLLRSVTGGTVSRNGGRVALLLHCALEQTNRIKAILGCKKGRFLRMQIVTVWCVFVGNMFYCVGSCTWVFLMVKICFFGFVLRWFFLLCTMVNHHQTTIWECCFLLFPSIKQANPWLLLQLFERGEIGTRTSGDPCVCKNGGVFWMAKLTLYH